MSIADKIVGRVGAAVLRSHIPALDAPDRATDGPALFRLDRLSKEHISAIVHEVLADPELHGRVEVRIPRGLVENSGLPDEVLTDNNAGAIRNQRTEKAAMLTANGNEPNLADTLEHVAAIGAAEFHSHARDWVSATVDATDMSLTPEDQAVFRAAIRGLLVAEEMSLYELAEYCSAVSNASTTKGEAIRTALGWALPYLHLPRDSSLFANARQYGHHSGPWRKAFEKLFTDRTPLIAKQRKNGQPIESSEIEERFNESRESINQDAVASILAFISSQPGERSAAQALCQFEWEADGIHLIFDRPKERKESLAKQTLDFFEHDCTDPDVLTPERKEYLADLATRESRSEWNDEDERFYELHRNWLDQDARLRANWEKALFGKPIECTDFLDGLVTAIQRLTASEAETAGAKRIKIRVNRGRKDWRERFNHDLGCYFSTMYRGLRSLLSGRVEFVRSPGLGSNPEVPDPLLEYPAFLEYERDRLKNDFKSVTSIARPQIQLKFEISLELTNGEQTVPSGKIHLLWIGRPQAVGLQLYDDIGRLRQKAAITATEVPRRLVSKKGGVQAVSLLDVNTFEATFGRDAGSLVPPPSKLKSLSHEIGRRLKPLKDEGRITEEQAIAISTALHRFEKDYLEALSDFAERGLHTEAAMRQADSFGELLRTLKENARGDVARSKLVSEVLRVGTVAVTGEKPCVIVPPWHPERMKALSVKLRRTCGLINHLLGTEHTDFGDRNIFFQEFSDELAHPFYPEIAVAERGGVARLVAETSTENGYSLMEEPAVGEGADMSDVTPLEASRQIRELIERYVSLQRHEASNLSIVLYNADAATLPLTTVRELSDFADAQPDLQCNVSVRHTDANKLRRVYAELVSSSEADPDMAVIGATSDSFMSKLRISVTPPNAALPEVAHGFRPFDIAFLHDVVSRTASPEWVRLHWLNHRNSMEHAPSRWSYRSISGEDELKSTTFLTCPQQTASGRAYVDMVGAVVRKKDVPPNDHLVPARQISLQDEKLKSLFDDAHSIAEWVATYDELLDKRQLLANNINVVRYRRQRTNGRNMIVSSTSELRLLRVLARRRLEELGLQIDSAGLDAGTDRIIMDALSISGDIVLRAAKRGVSAGEMLGLVLSRFIVRREFQSLCGGADKASIQVFFLLDDYASWLAQRENRIADLLGLCVEDAQDGIRLHLVVVESKYVGVANVADARRTSKTQLLATLSTLKEALFGDPGRLDRDLWLARLADLLVDAIALPSQTALLERARAAIRDGTIKMTLRGYSHVFVHSTEAGASGSSVADQVEVDVGSPAIAFQEVFDRAQLRDLAAAYVRNTDPTPVRASIGTETPWMTCNAVPPAPRVSWSAMVDKLAVDVSELSENNVGEPLEVVPTAATHGGVSTESATDTGQLASSNFDDLTVSTVAIAAGSAETGGNAAYGPALSSLIAQEVVQGGESLDDRGGWAAQIAATFKKAMNSYGFQASVLGTRLTPNGCLIRLAGSDRLRTEDIEAKRMQLLTTHSLALLSVQPRPGEIIVSIASPNRKAVSLWEVWERRAVKRNTAGINTSFVLGVQELNGNILYLNLGGDFEGLSQHEPHSLIAGSTGSGKSVLIQALLLDIAATNPSSLANIVLIDPKMGVDYSALEELPHLREPIITSRERAVEVLKVLVEEMEERYRVFASAKARDLPTYNAKVAPADRMPMVFVVHDEFADWMLEDTYKATVSAAVARLGVKARAAGIHLFFAAQRPDKDVMPMQLRENLGNRLILKVSSEATSRIALDRPGAELLLGKGHLAAKLTGEHGLLFAQAPFLSDEDIGLAVDAIKADRSRDTEA
ncbi:FtsK/SpoIIIE domain-containing protein [Caballeronia zhejiangensis]|uniref:Cell division protein FtsK n=1 Tax=Caballeronia zhejiangensis TaxID=871203 RepID=A0A656QGL7_9BURK|nr:FtsK/SpoIIIE domain-containing protein [Caballeronia zhejiangensis]KDR27149.1 cell division protein FtsK [Caballeronia zhejiangensis]